MRMKVTYILDGIEEIKIFEDNNDEYIEFIAGIALKENMELVNIDCILEEQ